MTKLTIGFILTLLFRKVSIVQGLFFSGHCDGPTCTDTVPTSCSDLILQHDVQGNDCCFSFVDTPEGGCEIIVTGDENTLSGDDAAFCSIKERTYDCNAQVRPTMQYSCQVHGAAYAPTKSNVGCLGGSAYESYDTSEHEIIAASTMTLSGMSYMTHSQAMDWEDVVAAHMQNFILSEIPELEDLISYPRVYIAENDTLVGDQFSNELSIVFLQFFTWRGGNATIDATSIRDYAFTSEAGKQSLLSQLQGSEFFATVTDLSAVETLEPAHEVPSNTPNATMISSFAKGDVVEGDSKHPYDDCYSVSRYMEDTIYSNGCTTTFLSYTYCNGGMNAAGEDTGIPKEIYYVAEVDLLHGCDDQVAYPDTCSITITANPDLSCTDCSYADGKVTMGPGCNEALNSVFQPDQTVELFFDRIESSYEEEFFSLSHDDWQQQAAMCAHPSVEVVMVSSYANAPDFVSGDPDLGHCYYAQRTMYDTIYSNGCTEVYLEYDYYVVGTGSYEVEVNLVHGCHPASGIEDSCSITVSGLEGTCNNCFYAGNSRITMVDCSDPFGDFFAPGTQTVEQPFGGTQPYKEQFFFLGYQSEEDCPAFNVPGMPTPAPPTSTPTILPSSSLAAYDTVVGDAKFGHCYNVDRYFEDVIDYNTGCSSTTLQYTYYNGGADTAYPKETYMIVDINARHNCTDEVANPTTCSLLAGNNTCECVFDDTPGVEKVTMGNCSSDFEELFSSGSQSVALYFSNNNVTYDEEFLSLAYDEEKCAHPLVEVFLLSSVAIQDRVAGDVSSGDCYYVNRYMEDTVFSNGCTSVIIQYTYYTGGMKPVGGIHGKEMHSGYPQKTYHNVYVDTVHGCHDARNRDTCKISAEGIDGSCECSYVGSGMIVMGRCSSSLKAIFAPGSLAVKQFFDGVSSTYGELFFTLAFDEDKCSHPSLISSNGPSYFFSVSPTAGPAQEMVTSFASGDIVEGDAGAGDCYLVDRYMEDTIYSDGCIRSYLWYTYYNGGANADYLDTGFPQQTYYDVEVTTWHSCDDEEANPDLCTISVHGINATCNNCFQLDRNRITMMDCTGSLGHVFPAENQTVELFFDGTESIYEEQFFSLAYDEDRCLHPAVGATVAPTPTPTPRPTA